MTSARNFLIRGLLAGLFAGLVAVGVAYVVGEPSVNASIAIEESAHGGGELVPRSLQSTVGLLTGTAVAGVTLGGLVGVLSALALGRIDGLCQRQLAAVRGVPAKSASRRPSGDHRHPHGALLHFGRDLDHRRRYSGSGWT